MLVILCTEQVREVRGFEQIHHFALLRSTARLSMMLFLVVKIEKPRLNLYFTGAFLAVISNNVLNLIAIASLLGAVTLANVISGKSGHMLTRRAHLRSVFPRYCCEVHAARCKNGHQREGTMLSAMEGLYLE